MSLTIAQALRKIKKLQGEISEHQGRVTGNVSYIKDKPPAFKFADELEKLNSKKLELIDLKARVTKANASKTVEFNGKKMSLAYAVRYLDELKGTVALLKGLYLRNEVIKTYQNEWNPVTAQHVVVPVETVWVCDLSEVDRDTQVKKLKDEFDALNDVVESANHKTTV